MTPLPPGHAARLAVLLDALGGVPISDAERPVSGVAGWVRGAHRGEHCRGDHPRPADPVTNMPDLPTTSDLAESGH
jgi:hypothetical protein